MNAGIVCYDSLRVVKNGIACVVGTQAILQFSDLPWF